MLDSWLLIHSQGITRSLSLSLWKLVDNIQWYALYNAHAFTRLSTHTFWPLCVMDRAVSACWHTCTLIKHITLICPLLHQHSFSVDWMLSIIRVYWVPIVKVSFTSLLSTRSSSSTPRMRGTSASMTTWNLYCIASKSVGLFSLSGKQDSLAGHLSLVS